MTPPLPPPLLAVGAPVVLVSHPPTTSSWERWGMRSVHADPGKYIVSLVHEDGDPVSYDLLDTDTGNERCGVPAELLAPPCTSALGWKEEGNARFRTAVLAAALCYGEALDLLASAATAATAGSSAPSARGGGGGGRGGEVVSVGSRVLVQRPCGVMQEGMVSYVEDDGACDVMYDGDEGGGGEEDEGVPPDKITLLAQVAPGGEEGGGEGEDRAAAALVVASACNLAQCYLHPEVSQPSAAEEAAEVAILADPSHAKAFYLRGRARTLLGDFKGAAVDLRTAKAAAPEDRPIREAIRALREAKEARRASDQELARAVVGLARGVQGGGGAPALPAPPPPPAPPGAAAGGGFSVGGEQVQGREAGQAQGRVVLVYGLLGAVGVLLSLLWRA